MKLSEEQETIVTSPRDSRILVNAGPGTGKTETACQRVAWLINEAGMQPNKIIVISFTRSAVAEIKARISLNLKSSLDADDLRISTIDSFAWQLRTGYSNSNEFSGYTAAIEVTNEEMASNPDLQKYLRDFRHIVIDEAQDIVGARCDSLSSIIQLVDTDCGISVFSDDAQAIYGFADDYVQGSADSYTLPELIRDHFDFTELELTDIHRTSDANLVKLFREGRAIANSTGEAPKKYGTMRDLIAAIAHEHSTEIPVSWDKELIASEDSFVLFRRRGEALAAAANMGSRARRVRLRGQSSPIYPWIAVCLFDFVEKNIAKKDFTQRYKERVKNDESEAASAWALLLKHAGTSTETVSMFALTRILSQLNPPSDLAPAEIGFQGPIFATIHSAKGREADEVNLCLYTPFVGDQKLSAQVEEEARVLFVGATRAKKKLKVSILDYNSYAGTQESGRAYESRSSSKFKTKYVQIELGLASDFTPQAMTGRDFFSTRDAAEQSQNLLSQFTEQQYSFHLSKVKLELDWLYAIRTGEDESETSLTLGYVSDSFQKDLFKACKYNATPSQIKYGVASGVHTLALSPDDDRRDLLHEPWATSGLMLAPTISDYLKAFYNEKKRYK